MLSAIGGLAARRPWRILIAAILFAAVAALVGSRASTELSASGFQDPGTETVLSQNRIAQASGVRPGPGVIAVVRPGAPVRSAEGRALVERVAARIAAEPGIGRVVSAFRGGGAALVSFDGTATYVVGSFTNIPDDEAYAVADRLVAAFRDDRHVTFGGGAVAGSQVGDIVGHDLTRAELIAFPVLLLLSFWVFRGLVAAILPPLMGGIVIVGAQLALTVLDRATTISVYALNLVIGLSLGLSIDYSLLVVSRYREEIAAHGPGALALRRTLMTAGRSVLFSTVTVAGALAGLMVFPQRFLFSMGLGGVIVAFLAATVSLVVLPAVLALLGRRVNALAPRRWRAHTELADRLPSSGGWYRLSRMVMRRPLPVAIAASAFLIALGIPAFKIAFTSVDASVLPTSASARQVADALRTEFPVDPGAPVTIAVSAPGDAGPRIAAWATRIGRLPGAEGALPPRRVGPGTWEVDVLPRSRALSGESQALVRAIRREALPYPVAAGGLSANFVDEKASISAHLPWAILVVVSVTLMALFVMTGSVVLPLKAVIMNLLTLSATLGCLVMIFQDGRFEGLLSYTSQGGVDLTQPILLGALAFGLSTDYAVFLLTRITEAREAGASDAEAVAIGLQRTGRIVTAAALLFCVAVGAFATSDIVIVKELGVGTAIAVALDATVVRAFLVPSLMALLGRWNWWAPAPLRRLHDRIGVRETLPAAEG